MATPARTGALAAAAGWTRAAAWAPDWRGAFSRALTREVEERRFFLWIPVAAMGGVALNLSADREPVLWLPALAIAAFTTLAWFCRARPLALGLSLAIAALFAGFLSMSLRTARVAAPVLDRIVLGENDGGKSAKAIAKAAPDLPSIPKGLILQGPKMTGGCDPPTNLTAFRGSAPPARLKRLEAHGKCG
jgi:hypothetical protein